MGYLSALISKLLIEIAQKILIHNHARLYIKVYTICLNSHKHKWGKEPQPHFNSYKRYCSLDFPVYKIPSLVVTTEIQHKS